MTAAIIAKYPWEEIKTISAGESERLFILSDSRISTPINKQLNKFKPLNWCQTLKQEVFSSNLIVCYSSSNLFALKKAFQEKLKDPTTTGLNSRLATERDITRLGHKIHKQHNIFGGYSEVLIAIWPKRFPSPCVYQLMAPDYKPKECHGIVGVGDRNVLKIFKNLLPVQLKNQHLISDDPQFDPRLLESIKRQFGYCYKPIVWKEARIAVHITFTEAVRHSESQTVDIPITSTLLDKNGIDKSLSSAVLDPNNKIVPITKFSKSSYYGARFKDDLYEGSPQNAEQLFD